MKITKSQLKQIIKEEISKVLSEGDLEDQILRHYHNIHEAITAALIAGPAGSDWFVDEFAGVSIPSSPGEEAYEQFIEEIQAFMDEQYLGKLEDLVLPNGTLPNGTELKPY